MEGDVLLDPLHFLTATDDARRSSSVACWNGDRLIGVMYTTEHYVHGIRSGYAIGGDYSGRGLLLCRPEHESAVMKSSIEEMVTRGIHSLHLRLLPRDHSKAVVAGMDMRYLDARIPGDRMSLCRDFDEFLSTLGKHTRRNVRYYMRKAKAAGIEFEPFLTHAEYAAGVARLNEGAFPAEPLWLARDKRLLELHRGGQRLGLRGPDGNLVAELCGFTLGGRFHVMRQLNDAKLERLSLSTVLRGWTVKHLIETGHTELQFMGGSSLIFGRYCAPQVYRSIFVDKREGVTAAAKRLSSKLVKLTALMGGTVPETLKLICNGHLEEWRLIERTALGPARIVFPEGSMY
jgi:Acetyltransferase (GNAT) domain